MSAVAYTVLYSTGKLFYACDFCNCLCLSLWAKLTALGHAVVHIDYSGVAGANHLLWLLP